MAEPAVDPDQEGLPEDDSSVRFEDLTVDDDLPILERVVKYSKSNIALQRLVHVKMLAETAQLSGANATQKVLLPCISGILNDPESVIRQHVAAQLLPVALVCMLDGNIEEHLENPELPKKYIAKGYRMVITTVMEYLHSLLADTELEVRRSAADSLVGLSKAIQPVDVPAVCFKIPLRLAGEKGKVTGKQKRSEADVRKEELRISAVNVLAEMIGSASEYPSLRDSAQKWVQESIWPCIRELVSDPSFRVRRCAAQAMPRLLGAGDMTDAKTILPVFQKLSEDDMHRVRKSTGECLVDMSRALMIVARTMDDRSEIYELRRSTLIPIAEKLIQDSHKMVRQGMMQFLGPFMASFYKFENLDVLPQLSESDGSHHMGIVAQFFPHATSMVSRLNSSQNATQSAPTPVHSKLEELSPIKYTEVQKLQRALPTFLHTAKLSHWSLEAVVSHRAQHPPEPEDIEIIVDKLLDYFVALAAVQTGDENTDAEMRVYCAYSFPAVVLLLGEDHWEGAVRTCFHTLLNPRYPEEEDEEDDESEPPLPVKRCLASSLHTVSHILGSDITESDIVNVVEDSFLNDTDDSVRLSTIRNFPSLIQLISPKKRRGIFMQWSELVRSEEIFVKNRSATNPTVLNWRQRDYLARSLPDLLVLMDPVLIHKYVWPILQELLSDTVNIVRDDAIWAIPILLKSYCEDTLSVWPHVAAHASKFSVEACSEVISWVKDAILNSSKASFYDRQLYCRICTAVALAVRFGEGVADEKNVLKDPVSVVSAKFKSFFFSGDSKKISENGPYQRLSNAEVTHLQDLLMNDLLPDALEMKEDRISNVRITLMKGLEMMPAAVLEDSKVKGVLKELQEESETWTSFGEEEVSLVEQAAQYKARCEGPVDVDEGLAAAARVIEESSESIAESSSNHSEGEIKETTAKASSTRSTETSESSSSTDVKVKKKLKSVVFEEGSIGMQLEPTADDSSCIVCGFLDGETPSPARMSGKINIGDVIVKINGNPVVSYDKAIETLRGGGRRKISFRPGRPDDLESDSEDDSSAKKKKKKKTKKVKKGSKKEKKGKKKEAK